VRQIPGAARLSPELFSGLTVYSHLTEPIGKHPMVVEMALKFAGEHQLGGRPWPGVIQSSDSENIVAGSVVRIRACSHRKDASRCREAVVRLTGAIREPVQVFVWGDVQLPDNQNSMAARN
jgi:hypothetical protein